MASNQPGASSAGVAKEYSVRVPQNAKKKYSIMKFNVSNNVDFTKCGSAKIERENNLKEYKLSHNLETMPKFGAGSEFGREQKDEARRKKYGIYLKKYNPEDQPWLLKYGEGKQAKSYKGTKEGGFMENSAYYIFTQCSDGAFEACPVEEWYNFNPQIKYKYLNSEEAEEEFSRRDKTLNYFSIMLKKRLRNEDDDDEEDKADGKKKKKGKKKNTSFQMTDQDDWMNISDDDDMDDDSDEEKKDDDEDKPKKGKGKGKGSKSKRPQRTNSDDEALEDSDDLDEGQEVDYMTSSDSDDDDMYQDKDREDDDKYQEKGVEDEEGLRKVIDSEDEEEEQEKKKEGEEEEGEKENGEKEKKEGESESSDSSASDSESDPEKETNFASALFMQKKKKSKKESSAENTPANSRSATPINSEAADAKNKKRKAGEDDVSAVAKKSKVDATTSSTAASASQGSSEGINEESVRRYLLRKPMTITDLMKKFKSKNTGLDKEQLGNTLAQVLKRLDPIKKKIKDKLFLYIKPDEKS